MKRLVLSILVLLAAGTPLVFALFHGTGGTLVPWVYDANGELVAKRHEHREETPNAVACVAWNFFDVAGQTTKMPDVLVLSGPHFEPPRGVPTGPGTRRLLTRSIQDRALQLYLNYSGVQATPSDPLYLSPTFFVSQGGVTQATPAIVDVGLAGTFIAPTSVALGVVGVQMGRGTRAPLWHEAGATTFSMNAMYVTAGVDVAFADLDPASLNDVRNASKDRLFVLQPNQTWVDVSALVPIDVRRGNSSGACFADFDGDGWLDLFVGRYGDNFSGDQSSLLVFDPSTSQFNDVTTGQLPVFSFATVAVVASDLDLDSDMDIVLANRANGFGPAGPESEDAVLINDGTGNFTLLVLSPGKYTDTRSVAVGELDYVPGPEIVLGNAGADGISNVLAVPPTENHPMQIFRNHANYPALNLQDSITDFMSGSTELAVTEDFTNQVILADVFGPGIATNPSAVVPDGYLDLFVVNHRNILISSSGGAGSNVQVLVNPGPGTSRLLEHAGALANDGYSWATGMALADFTHNATECSPGTIDFFICAGNTYSGCDQFYVENRGALAGAWPPWNFAITEHLSYEAMPGTERGYGFDFADVDDDNMIDMIQTSRGYNFVAFDLGFNGGHGANRHWVLSDGASSLQLSNKRGQLSPIGAEDACFGDFDLDGKLDALLATQARSSPFHPLHPEVGDTLVLRGKGPAGLGFLCASATVPATHLPPTVPSASITTDALIDLNGRTAYARSGTTDRAIVCDFDNDGDDDAIVHLFPILGDGTGPNFPMLGTGGLSAPVGAYSAGWRYLQNTANAVPSTGYWFKDVGARKLHHVAYLNGFSPEWNRQRGFDVAGDFDNNGACDFVSVSQEGGSFGTGPGFSMSTAYQADDVIFMNGVSPAPKGALVEKSTQFGFPRRRNAAGTIVISASGLAQGDVDNDGFADIFIACRGRTKLSELLMNRLSTPSANFVDEFQPRVNITAASMSPEVHSESYVLNPSLVHDEIGTPLLVDFDADGDLDLIYPVSRNVPRIMVNDGSDTNLDGFVDANDSMPPGTFTDLTSARVKRMRPIVDSVDAQAVDIDRDGDYDVAIDCFDDEIVLLRNDIVLGDRPSVTDAWPRVGAIRGRSIVLEGAHLDDVVEIELVSRTTGTRVTTSITSGLTLSPNGKLTFTLPVGAPLGLNQVRVRRGSPPTPQDEWSRQYFGYFVLE